MEVQSISVCVPAGCPNNCKFCVSQTHTNEYHRRQFVVDYFADSEADDDFEDRLEYARDNGVQCLILTGTGEPLMNQDFIRYFGNVNRGLNKPFRHIEIQTSGVTLDRESLEVLRYTGVKTISLSLSSLIGEENANYNGTPQKLQFNIMELCKMIKARGFNLRVSLNMTDAFNGVTPEHIFWCASELGANQLTFRVLYESGKGHEQDNWINEHRCNPEMIEKIHKYIKYVGEPLHRLSFGAMKYDVGGISTVVDEDCMNTKVGDGLKYFILREDCRLYTHWDKKGSLVY